MNLFHIFRTVRLPSFNVPRSARLKTDVLFMLLQSKYGHTVQMVSVGNRLVYAHFMSAHQDRLGKRFILLCLSFGTPFISSARLDIYRSAWLLLKVFKVYKRCLQLFQACRAV